MIIESPNFHTSSILDIWYCWERSTQRKRRNVSSIVTIGLGRKMLGWFYGMLLLSAKCPRPPGRWENSLWKTIRRTIQRTNNSICSNGWVSPDINTRSVKTSSVWQEGFTMKFLGYALIAKGIWKGDILNADTEELESMDASDYTRRINAREVLITQKGEEFIFPIADGTAKWSGRDYEFREPSPRLRQTAGSEDLSGELQGESEEPQPTEPKNDAEAQKDFWSIQSDFIYRHHIEPRVQLYVPKEETLPMPLKYIDVARSTHTHLDVMQENRCRHIHIDLHTSPHFIRTRKLFSHICFGSRWAVPHCMCPFNKFHLSRTYVLAVFVVIRTITAQRLPHHWWLPYTLKPAYSFKCDVSAHRLIWTHLQNKQTPTIFAKMISDLLGCRFYCSELIKTVIFVFYWRSIF